jgi:NADPH-dependent curcumin reductase CurA
MKPCGADCVTLSAGGAVLISLALGIVMLALALHGRVVICGAISTYNDDGPTEGPKNYLNLLVRRGRMEGFLVLDYMDRLDEATAALHRWLREGKLKDRVSVVEGFENAPAALARLFTGENLGKQLVKIADE